ncbi:MAG: hypothetical protein V3V05_08510 [Pontiella sp.]
MKQIKFSVIARCIGLSTGCATRPQWYKGNTHTHTFWSDGKEFPETAADRYKDMGYHFLALSDHNIVSRGAGLWPCAVQPDDWQACRTRLYP